MPPCASAGFAALFDPWTVRAEGPASLRLVRGLTGACHSRGSVSVLNAYANGTVAQCPIRSGELAPQIQPTFLQAKDFPLNESGTTAFPSSGTFFKTAPLRPPESPKRRVGLLSRC